MVVFEVKRKSIFYLEMSESLQVIKVRNIY